MSFPTQTQDSPLMSLVQTLDVSPNYETAPKFSASMDFEENTKFLGGKFSKCSISATKRKQMFSQPHPNLVFDPSVVYTFDFYQDLVDLRLHSFRILGQVFALNNFLAGQVSHCLWFFSSFFFSFFCLFVCLL